jgi:hypothetical protein
MAKFPSGALKASMSAISIKTVSLGPPTDHYRAGQEIPVTSDYGRSPLSFGPSEPK